MNQQLMYALADMLNMELLYNKKLKVFSGKTSFNIIIGPNSSITLTAKVLGGYASPNSSAVLVHVRKNLHLYVTAESRGEDFIEHKVAVLNIPPNIVDKLLRVAGSTQPLVARSVLAPNVIATYEWVVAETKWRKINVVSVDSRQGISSKQTPVTSAG